MGKVLFVSPGDACRVFHIKRNSPNVFVLQTTNIDKYSRFCFQKTQTKHICYYFRVSLGTTKILVQTPQSKHALRARSADSDQKVADHCRHAELWIDQLCYTLSCPLNPVPLLLSNVSPSGTDNKISCGGSSGLERHFHSSLIFSKSSPRCP